VTLGPARAEVALGSGPRSAVGRSSGGSADRSKYVFLLPAVVLILVLSVFPLVFSLALAFLSWDLSRLEGGVRWVGLDNFRTLLSDGRAFNTTRITLTFVVGAVALQYVLGLGLALLLSQEIRFRRFFRIVFLLPMMLTPAAVGYVGRMMLNESIGPVNDAIKHLGLPLPAWITNPALALPSVVLVDSWEWTPFVFIVLLAGLQSLPTDVYEAAHVDGASGWQTFRYVTFPLLVPISVTVVLIRALEAFKLFDIVSVMTGGGPGTATETVTLYAYLVAMKNGNLGYASAIAYSLLVLVTIFSLAFLNGLRHRGGEAT
jgi:multiple sugar transport system permease protein